MTEAKRITALVVGTVLVGGALIGWAKASPDEHADDHAKAPAPAPATKPAAPKVAPAPTPSVARAPAAPTKGAAPAAKHTTAPRPAPTDAKPAPSREAEGPMSADDALRMLMDGNARWVAGTMQSPNTDASRRQAQSDKGQTPFAAVYTCADSRLPVERVFDRGVGEIFVSRIAGNVVAEHQAGTLEYAVEHLHTPLLVVMGHTKCGAVKAAIAGGSLTPNIDALLNDIKPAVERARTQMPEATEEQLLGAAIRENVWQGVYDLLKSSEVLREHVAQGKLKVVGAVCDLATGKVNFMGEHPWQAQLVDAFSHAEKGAGATEGE